MDKIILPIELYCSQHKRGKIFYQEELKRLLGCFSIPLGEGFFTKKFDKILAFIFLLFLIFNALIMRINYWEVSPFLLTLYYSKLLVPQKNNQVDQVETATLSTT